MKGKIIFLFSIAVLCMSIVTSCENEDIQIQQSTDASEKSNDIKDTLSRSLNETDSLPYLFVNVMKGEDPTTAVPVKKVTASDAQLIRARMFTDLSTEMDQYKLIYTTDSLEAAVDNDLNLAISVIGAENFNGVKGLLKRYATGIMDITDIINAPEFQRLTTDGQKLALRCIEMTDNVLLPLFNDVYDILAIHKLLKNVNKSLNND